MNVGGPIAGQNARMTDRSDLTPAAQQRLLAGQMRISRAHDAMAKTCIVEALARSREYLLIPICRWQDLRTEAALKAAYPISNLD